MPPLRTTFATVGAVVGIAALAVAGTTVVLTSGVGGPADGAFGEFQDTRIPWEVCTLLPTHELPPTVTAFTPVGGDVLLTSPGGGGTSDGTVVWRIRDVRPDGVPGDVLGGGAFDLSTLPPAYPDTLAATMSLTETFTISNTVDPPPALCVETTHFQFHIVTKTVPGTDLLFSRDGEPWQLVPNADLAYSLEVEIDDGSGGADGGLWIEQGGAGQGAGNAAFDTRFFSFNPSDALLDFNVDLTERDSGDVVPRAFQVAPDSVYTETASALLAPEETFGSLEFVPDPPDGDPMIQAIISANLPNGDQYGQFFQAKDAGAALQAGETAWLFTTPDPVRNRVNVGVTAVEDGTEVMLTPVGPGGVGLAPPTTIDLGRGENTQISNIFSRWGLGTTEDVMIEVEVASGAALSYSSILDGRGQVPGTSDPTSVLPVTEGAGRVVLLEVGDIFGLNEFSGSAMLFNHDPDPVDVMVTFHDRGVPGVSASTVITATGRTAVSWNNAVVDLVGRRDTVGALVFTVQGGKRNGGGLSAVGREFAIFRGNGGQITGTAGQAMPGLTDADMLRPGQTFHFIGLRDRQLPEGPERSHLGLLNLGFADVTVTVRGFAADGSFEGEIERSVRGREQVRVNRILRAINSAQDGGVKRIEVTVRGGPVHALAYFVNSTGDPVTLLPFRR